MTAKELKSIINCNVNFFTFIPNQLPIETNNSDDFYEVINTAVSKIQKELSDTEYKKFEKIIVETLFVTFPDDEELGIPYCKIMREGHDENMFLMLSKDNEHAPLPYTQERVYNIISYLIQDNLSDAIVEFYTFSNTLPSTGQIFDIYAYERKIQQIFKAYPQLHDIFSEAKYYLEEWRYEERQCFNDFEIRPFGQLNLRFCRYDTNGILPQ